MERNLDRLHSFRLLGQACIGALIGALFSILIAALTLKVGGRPSHMPGDLLPWNLHNVWFKPREKGFYLCALVLAPVFAYLLTAKLWRLPAFITWLILIISVPITNFLARNILQQDAPVYLLIGLMCVFIPFILLVNWKAARYKDQPLPITTYQSNWKISLVFLTLITLIVIPNSFTTVAARIGMEFHVASTLIGPALYFLNGHLLPGVDYYTQYSIGQPWLFSFFLGSTAEKTMVHYVMFAIITTWIFFIQFYYLTQWL